MTRLLSIRMFEKALTERPAERPDHALHGVLVVAVADVQVVVDVVVA